jgi:glyoxylase-like metal-dependent hydrolase (beta-lactamase superfamily II)
MLGELLVSPVVPGVHRIDLGVVNAYVLQAEDGVTLVDTGLAATRPLLLRAMKVLGVDVRDIRRILVTHAHPDHTGSLAYLKRMSGARVYMHCIRMTPCSFGREGRSGRGCARRRIQSTAS